MPILNIHGWVETLVEEHFDSLWAGKLYGGDDELKDWVDAYLNDKDALAEWVEEALDNIETHTSLIHAIIETIDFKKLLQTTKTYIVENYDNDALCGIPYTPDDDDTTESIVSAVTVASGGAGSDKNSVSSSASGKIIKGFTIPASASSPDITIPPRVINSNWEDSKFLPIKWVEDSEIKKGDIIRHIYIKEASIDKEDTVCGLEKKYPFLRGDESLFDSRIHAQILYKVTRVNKVHLSTRMCDLNGNMFGDVIMLSRGGRWRVFDKSLEGIKCIVPPK